MNQLSENSPPPEDGEQKVSDFETDLSRLEDIVAQLEQGNLPLDDALQLYEEGIEAYRRCSKMLQKAETRVVKLIETLEGELREEELSQPEEEEGQ